MITFRITATAYNTTFADFYSSGDLDKLINHAAKIARKGIRQMARVSYDIDPEAQITITISSWVR